MVIKSHKALAEAIQGKSILHANSLGKDSAVTLHWLVTFAKPKRIVSLFFERFTVHPAERKYLEYQKAKYPTVEFMVLPDPIETSMIIDGLYQRPEDLSQWNHLDYSDLERGPIVEEVMKEQGLDFVCDGQAGYECLGRAQRFHKKGLLIGKTIYPIGLMKKAQIVELIRTCRIRLNPTYKYYGSTFDQITYWRMRAAMKACPEYKQILLTYFPMFRADIFRYEVVNEELRRSEAAKAQAQKGAQAPQAKKGPAERA